MLIAVPTWNGGNQLVMCRIIVCKESERVVPSHLHRLGQPSTFSHLFLGGEVNLIGVVAAISRLLAGTGTYNESVMSCGAMLSAQGTRLTSRSRATGTAGVGLHVLGVGPVASALAGGAGTAGAAGTGDGVLLGGLVAGAVQGGLLAAGALGLLGCVLMSEMVV